MFSYAATFPTACLFQSKCSAATLDSEGNFNLGSDLDSDWGEA